MTTPSSPPSSSALALSRVCTVVPVLRFLRIDSVAGVIDMAHVSGTFRDAIENYSPTVWRRLASSLKDTPHRDSTWTFLEPLSLESSPVATFFCRDAFAWAAENMLTVGQLDISRMEKHPLCVAAGNGAADVVRMCLSADPARVNVRDCHGWTALHAASLHGHAECVRVLLAAGADITIGDEFDYTALHRAADKGRVDCLRLLVAHPDFVKIRDKLYNVSGGTALDLACRRGSTECVRELLAAGADITLVDCYNSSALHNAALEGNAGVVRLLVAHADYEKIRDQRNNHGKTAMDAAKTDEVKELLSKYNK